MGTVSASVGQTGYILIIGPGPYDWIPQDLPITLTRSDEPGFTLDFGYAYNYAGFPMAPALPYTTKADVLANLAANVWTLTLETSLTSTSQIPKFYMVLDPKPWGGTSPTTRTDRTEGKSMLVERLFQNSPTWVLNANGSTYDLVWEFDFTVTGDNYLDSATEEPLSARTHPFHDLVNDPMWNGTFKFHFDADGAISMAINAITFTGEARDFHYGTMSQPMDVHARAVHCYITGQPYMSHEAVRDDWRDNVMVHPDNYDPADPLDTDYFTPPPGEGVVDDEIDNIE